MDALRRQIEAIEEAANFIRETWIRPTTLLWRGSVDDFHAAVIGAGMTREDIAGMLTALAAGEPVPVDGVSGVWNRAGELVEVVVYRPLEVGSGC
jgi:hypothetical protein